MSVLVSDVLETLDAFLADVRHQSLLDGDKVRDFLLDLRLDLAALSLWISE